MKFSFNCNYNYYGAIRLFLSGKIICQAMTKLVYSVVNRKENTVYVGIHAYK